MKAYARDDVKQVLGRYGLPLPFNHRGFFLLLCLQKSERGSLDYNRRKSARDVGTGIDSDTVGLYHRLLLRCMAVDNHFPVEAAGRKKGLADPQKVS